MGAPTRARSKGPSDIVRGWLVGTALLTVIALPFLTAAAQDTSPALSEAEASYAAGPDLRDYVSPELSPDERAFMRTYINSMPRAIKEQIVGQPVGSISVAVVDGANGVIHYNRPEDAGSYKLIPALNLPGADRPDASNTTKDPGVYGGSGPYRRVYTVPLPAAPAPHPDAQGYYQQEGVVSTTCEAGHFETGDQGYSYMGGWSATWNTAGGNAAVDAGLAYNYEAGADDDYSVFINLGKSLGGIISTGNAESPGGSKAYLQPTHIACYKFGAARLNFSVFGTPQLRTLKPDCYEGTGNDSTFIGFPIAACNTYAMMLMVTSEHFKTFKGDHTGFIMWVSPDITIGGWAHLVPFTAPYWNGKHNVPGYEVAANCGGCIFKWMTSIAQSGPNDLSDGSDYGAAWFEREISNYALGESSTAGGRLIKLTAKLANCSEYPLWHPPYGTDHQADCTNTPDGLKGLAQIVKVKDYGPDGELDIIEAYY
jgi:hypothetical protein